MADLMPEQRKAAAYEEAWDLINAISDPVLDAIHHGESGVQCADSIKTALIALGWRAPGPPTDAEMDRAVAAYIEVARSQTWLRSTDPQKVASHLAGFHRVLVRAVLTAALGRPE